jgi:hypothetical protein
MSWLKETDMFYNNTMMSIANMDNTLRGWAKLDTAAGETAIQSNVIWDIGIVNYTDATAKQYLIDTYGWTNAHHYVIIKHVCCIC